MLELAAVPSSDAEDARECSSSERDRTFPQATSRKSDDYLGGSECSATAGQRVEQCDLVLGMPRGTAWLPIRTQLRGPLLVADTDLPACNWSPMLTSS